jgi:hypothetical protein
MIFEKDLGNKLKVIEKLILKFTKPTELKA